MAKRNSSNKGLILGTVFGSLAGAAYALWKTPMSGQELRSKLSTGPINTSSGTSANQTSTGGGFTDKVMNAVEHTLAPIVGVNLGKTANQGGKSAISVADTPADVAPPAQVQTATSAAGTPIADPNEGEAMMATGDDTIRMKKFAWGTPAPEAEKAETPVQGEMNAPVEQATSVNEPVVTPEPASSVTTTATTTEGQDKIRSQRFAWGDPKPDSADTTIDAPIASSDMMPEQRSQPVAESEPAATSTVDTESVGSSNVADTIVASAASFSTGKMAPFPKLGGLEKQ